MAAIYERDYVKALDYVDSWEVDDEGRLDRYTYKESMYGVTHRMAGQSDLADRNFRAVSVLIEAAIENVEKKPPVAVPEEHFIHLIRLAEAYAGLGRAEEASVLANKAIEMVPLTKHAVWGAVIRQEAIRQVFVVAGDYDAVIAHLETYLATPGM